MRLKNIDVKFNIEIPFGDHPDLNRVICTREAVENAVQNFRGNLPILFKSQDLEHAVAIGNTSDSINSVTWDEDNGCCRIAVSGTIYFGGMDCTIDGIDKNGYVSAFSINAIGISN